MKKPILLCLLLTYCFAGGLNLMYWNVENLFDIEDDPLKRDNDFLPGGSKRYTYRCFCLKVQHLAEVINLADPDLLAMVEVENRRALEYLCAELHHKTEWEIVIDDGPDIRGIDPALIFRKDKFIYCSHEYYPVFIKERGYHSRPIMRVDLALTETNDTISIMVNHWPSRRGGKEATDPFRNYAASVLIEAVNTTLKEHPSYTLIITGDFNNDRQDECLTMLEENGFKYLEKALPPGVGGTYYHDGEWIHFDHFLTVNDKNMKFRIKGAEVFAPHWIRESDTNGPLRFYKGLDISGGYSDHFPILIKLAIERKNVE